MRSCAFPDDPTAFNHSNPSLAAPYTLDLSEPYQSAVLSELLFMFKEGHNCKIESLSHKADIGSRETNITLAVKNGELVTKNNGYFWEPPSKGIVKVDISYNISIPSMADKLSESSFILMSKMIVAARSETDRKNWLWLLCLDLFFSTDQVFL